MHPEIFSVEQMYEADRRTIEGGVPGLTLMENAGQGIASEILARWMPQPVLVLCGPGNNGGDGYVIARALEGEGWPVTVAAYGDPETLKGDALEMYRRYEGEVTSIDGLAFPDHGLVVDAIFGAGFRGDLPADLIDLFAALEANDLSFVAVDMPSGVDGATGEMSDGVPEADLTVTFFRPKIGHLLFPGRRVCGELVVVDIGIPESVLNEIEISTFLNGPDLWLQDLPVLDPEGHKYSRGHAAICGGGVSSTGAARIAARNALRIGAGAVTVLSPPSALVVYSTALEAVMVRSIADQDELSEFCQERRIGAIAIGPGNGVNDRTRANVLAALQTAAHVILDADALTVFQNNPKQLFEVIKQKTKGEVVLTPHEAEFARLFAVDGNALERCRAAASLSGAIVLLKGATTVIADPSGRAVLNASAPPWLATAGSGDALTGIITGLTLGCSSVFSAVAAGAWVHADAANWFGPGLIAEDIEAQIPDILQQFTDDFS